MVEKIAEIGVYDEEEIHTGCLVVVFSNRKTGESRFFWRDPEGDADRTIPVPDLPFDEIEAYENCTVEIWRNSVTGASSVGWRRGTEGSGCAT